MIDRKEETRLFLAVFNMAAIINNENYPKHNAAEFAVKYADELIALLEKTKPKPETKE
jgi:hypothetical protein